VSIARRSPTLVAGEWSGGAADDWYEIRNPADAREVVAEVPALGREDIEPALVAAAKAQRLWRATSIVRRGEILRCAAALIRERQDEIAQDVTLEMGKLIVEARGEVAKAADFLEYYASFGRMSIGEVLPDARPGSEARAVREPRGVVVAITPWNDPVITPARKACPALIAGNAMVIKAAPESPLSALHLARALHDAGLPAGVLTILTGPDAELPKMLAASDGFQALTFTGSTGVGLELQRALAGRNIPLQTEMGGTNAAVVLDDANLDLVIDALVSGAFVQAGQRCTATSRVLIAEQRYDEVLERLAGRAMEIRVGAGLDEHSQMGPLVAEHRLASVLGTLERSRRSGAVIVSGGDRLTDDGLVNGWFLGPTVVGGVDGSAEIWNDELFGPVAAVGSVSSLDRAIELVNDTRYGLSAAVFTRDLEAAHYFVEAVDAGNVAVNLPTAGWDVQHPFGGFKDSGSAFKEQGVAAFDFYCRTKTIAMRTRGI
jgi:acyl-CoA reductase-like NAD-dependent aldehyde dehydrogenase